MGAYEALVGALRAEALGVNGQPQWEKARGRWRRYRAAPSPVRSALTDPVRGRGAGMNPQEYALEFERWVSVVMPRDGLAMLCLLEIDGCGTRTAAKALHISRSMVREKLNFLKSTFEGSGVGFSATLVFKERCP